MSVLYEILGAEEVEVLCIDHMKEKIRSEKDSADQNCRC